MKTNQGLAVAGGLASLLTYRLLGQKTALGRVSRAALSSLWLAPAIALSRAPERGIYTFQNSELGPDDVRNLSKDVTELVIDGCTRPAGEVVKHRRAPDEDGLLPDVIGAIPSSVNTLSLWDIPQYDTELVKAIPKHVTTVRVNYSSLPVARKREWLGALPLHVVRLQVWCDRSCLSAVWADAMSHVPPTVKRLDMNGQTLQGDIFGKLPSHLTYLDLSYCKLDVMDVCQKFQSLQLAKDATINLTGCRANTEGADAFYEPTSAEFVPIKDDALKILRDKGYKVITKWSALWGVFRSRG